MVRASLPLFVAEIFGGGFFQGGEFAIQFRVRNFSGDSPQDGARIVFHDVAGENAEGRERAGERGDDDVRNAEGFGEGAGVEASGATEGDEGEVAGIASALDGDDADGFFHGRVDHADDSGGELFEREATSLLLEQFCVTRRVRSRSSVKSPPRKRVGCRRPRRRLASVTVGCGAASVADGTGIGSGGFGADAQDSGGVEAGEGASAGTDGVNVEHGDADGKARDLGVGGGFDFAFDERDVGGGASHVEGDDAVEAAGAGGGDGADDASGGAGEDGADGFAGGGGEGGDAAGGLHDEDAGTGAKARFFSAFRGPFDRLRAGSEGPLFHGRLFRRRWRAAVISRLSALRARFPCLRGRGARGHMGLAQGAISSPDFPDSFASRVAGRR